MTEGRISRPGWHARYVGLHRRSVLLDGASRSIKVVDQIDGSSHDIHLAFRLGSNAQAELEESLTVHADHTRHITVVGIELILDILGGAAVER